MKKLITGMAVAAAFALPVVALASVSVDNILFANGTGNVTASEGSSVPVSVYLDTSGTNDVESVFVTFPGAGGIAQQGVCYDVTDLEGASPTNGWVSTFNVTVPVNPGVWPITVATHGTNGDDADQGCFTSADATQTFNGRVTVTSDNSTGSATGNSGGTNGGATPSQLDVLTAQVQALVAAFSNFLSHGGAGTGGSTGSSSAVCQAYAQANSGTMSNTTNAANVRLQGFLLSQGESIPALAAGASFGFYGNQTTAAVGAFQAANHCN